MKVLCIFTPVYLEGGIQVRESILREHESHTFHKETRLGDLVVRAAASPTAEC